MQLGWLRTFLAVYRTDSFTKAAKQLQLSQPAVTQQIRALEAELDKPLFSRSAAGVRPTPTADRLAREIIGPIDALDETISRRFHPDAPERPVYLGGPAELITARVLPALSDLISDGLTLRIGFGLADDLLADLAEGAYDLVLSTIRPRIRGIEAIPLADEEFMLVGAPPVAHRCRAALRDRAEPDVLEHVPLIAYAEMLPIIRRYWQSVFDVKPDMTPAVVVPDLRGVLSAVKSGAGISVLPSYLCQDELASGEIVPLLEPEIPPINTFYLATRAGTSRHRQIALVQGQLLMKAQVWT
jgi:DNA-binding transcriptional LysR family regulator